MQRKHPPCYTISKAPSVLQVFSDFQRLSRLLLDWAPYVGLWRMVVRTLFLRFVGSVFQIQCLGTKGASVLRHSQELFATLPASMDSFNLFTVLLQEGLISGPLGTPLLGWAPTSMYMVHEWGTGGSFADGSSGGVPGECRILHSPKNHSGSCIPIIQLGCRESPGLILLITHGSRVLPSSLCSSFFITKQLQPVTSQQHP